MKKTHFYCYRYFVTKGLQMPLIEKSNFIERMIVTCREGKIEEEIGKDRIYGLIYVRNVIEKVHLLKFYKLSTVTKYEFDSNEGISAVHDPSVPFVYVIIDTAHQIVLLSKNTTVFQKEGIGKRAFESFVKNFLSDSNVVFSLDSIVDNREFWELVSNSEKIYKLSLRLRSPNLFGAESSMSSFLEEVQNATNTDSVQFELQSENGNLDIKPNDFRDAVAYADGGGGDWSMEAKLADGSSKRTITSASKIMTADVASLDEHGALLSDNDEGIIKALNKAEQVLPKQQESIE